MVSRCHLRNSMVNNRMVHREMGSKRTCRRVRCQCQVPLLDTHLRCLHNMRPRTANASTVKALCKHTLASAQHVAHHTSPVRLVKPIGRFTAPTLYCIGSLT